MTCTGRCSSCESRKVPRLVCSSDVLYGGACEFQPVCPSVCLPEALLDVTYRDSVQFTYFRQRRLVAVVRYLFCIYVWVCVYKCLESTHEPSLPDSPSPPSPSLRLRKGWYSLNPPGRFGKCWFFLAPRVNFLTFSPLVTL